MQTVHLAVPASNLVYYDADGCVVEPGTCEVIAGRHAGDSGVVRASFIVC